MGYNPGEAVDYVIVGLGNPGRVYENTRHNIGFKVVDYIDDKSVISRGCKRLLHTSLTDKCVLAGRVVFIVKPQTYMNNSGMAVADILRYYKLLPNKLIVIHDDITLPVGRFKIKRGGSAGGHNGIKSIIQHIGSDDFIHIKVGVGQKPENWELSNYVLSKIPEDEYKLISANFDKIVDAVKCIMGYGVERAMSTYNA